MRSRKIELGSDVWLLFEVGIGFLVLRLGFGFTLSFSVFII